MKKLALSLIVLGSLLSGCVAYDAPYRDREPSYRGDRDHDREGRYRDHDRDGDGVSNRRDNHPNDPRRD